QVHRFATMARMLPSYWRQVRVSSDRDVSAPASFPCCPPSVCGTLKTVRCSASRLARRRSVSAAARLYEEVIVELCLQYQRVATSIDRSRELRLGRFESNDRQPRRFLGF